MRRRTLLRAARNLVAVLLAAELLYVLIANTVIFSGLIQHEASIDPETALLDWDQAYSPWPGRAYVSGFHLRVQDPVQEFRLTVDHASVDVVLWELFRKRFRATRVRAEGVSYRMLLKVDSPAGKEQRLAAFPIIEGLPRPALTPKPAPPPATPEDMKGIWKARLDDVDTTVRELWFLEYRYQGAGRVRGGFAFDPLRKLWVGPAVVELQGGKLTAGEHVVAAELTAHLNVTLTTADIPSSPGLRILQTLTSSIQLDTSLTDLGAADLYVAGLDVRGAGKLVADVGITDGKLTPGTTLALTLPDVSVALDDYHFKGPTQAKLTVTEDAGATAAGKLAGALEVPWFGKIPPRATLSGVTADLAFADGDLARGLHVQRLHVTLGEARVGDAQAITAKAGDYIPVAAPLVLGKGPLLASASLHLTPDYTLVRLTHLTLGSAALEGAALEGAKGWTGAAQGHFGALQLGFRLRDSKLEPVPFPSGPWLGSELNKLGILAD